MAEFILVHGGFHGAWCWDLLVPELARLGHASFAMDLPVDQPDVWIDDYVRIVQDAVAGKASDDAYLVGHSYGGMIVPRVARERPLARMILLCAGFAHTNDAELAEMQAVTDTDSYYRWLEMDDRGRARLSPENAIAAFYHDVPPDLADWAVGKLRPHWAEAMAKVGPVEPYADRIAGIIDCADDRIFVGDRHRVLARKRYGIDPVVLPGSHSPFLSNPALLARALDSMVR